VFRGLRLQMGYKMGLNSQQMTTPAGVGALLKGLSMPSYLMRGVKT